MDVQQLLQVIQSQNERLDKLEKQNKKLKNELKVMKFHIQVSLQSHPEQGSWTRSSLIKHYLATTDYKLYLDLLKNHVSHSYFKGFQVSSIVFKLKNELLTEYYMYLIISELAIPFDDNIWVDEFFGHVCIYWYNHGIPNPIWKQEGFTPEFELFHYAFYVGAEREIRHVLNSLLIPYWDINLCNLILPYLNLPHHEPNSQYNLGDWSYWTKLVKRRDGTNF
jgi:hypothetical protein